MKLLETVYTILNLLSRHNVSDDFRVSERNIAAMVHAHRAAQIVKDYGINQHIDPTWLSDIGRIDFTRVSSSDDPNITNSSLCLAKITLPPVISLDNDGGVYRISSSSKQIQCYPTTPNEFFFLFENNDKRLQKYHYYFRIGNAYYKYPYQTEGSAILVLSNPLDGWAKFTENILSGFLTIGDTFIVMSGSITYGGITYTALQTFVATVANGTAFTGTGIVQYLNKKRKMTMQDEYPMSRSMESELILSILSNEFRIEAVMTPDIINDARDYALRRLQERKTK